VVEGFELLILVGGFFVYIVDQATVLYIEAISHIVRNTHKYYHSLHHTEPYPDVQGSHSIVDYFSLV
jgi:hypothetical protein